MFVAFSGHSLETQRGFKVTTRPNEPFTVQERAECPSGQLGSMPPDHGLRFDDEQHVRPSGHRCRSVVQKKRSRRVNVGRGRWRLSTATCCWSARTSRAVSLRLQTNTLSATRTENRNSSMTRPCFITWCGRNQPTAPDRNLLILKHDTVLATHRRARHRAPLRLYQLSCAKDHDGPIMRP